MKTSSIHTHLKSTKNSLKGSPLIHHGGILLKPEEVEMMNNNRKTINIVENDPIPDKGEMEDMPTIDYEEEKPIEYDLDESVVIYEVIPRDMDERMEGISDSLELEDDPAILKATIDMVSTPHSNDNINEAVDVIANIQNQCASDFVSLCAMPEELAILEPFSSFSMGSSVGGPVENILEILFSISDSLNTYSQDEGEYEIDEYELEDMPMESRRSRKLSIDSVKTYKSYPPFNSMATSALSSLRSVSEISNSILHPLWSRAGRLAGMAKSKTGRRLYTRPGGGPVEPQIVDDDDYYDDDNNIDDDYWGNSRQSGRSEAYLVRANPNPNPNPLSPPAPPGHSDRSHRGPHGHKHGGPGLKSDSEFGMDGEQRVINKYDRPDQYSPSLGYGAEGDMCLLDQYQSLSIECKDALNSAEAFRHDYWEEEREIVHSKGTGGIFFLLLILYIAYLLRNKFNKIEKERKIIKENTTQMLLAIHNNPRMKMAVESVYGSDIPPLESSLPKKVTFPRFVLRFFLMFWLSCIILQISMVITQSLLSDIVFRNEQGTESPPSHLLIFGVFMCVLVCITGITVLMIRVIRSFYTSCCTNNSTNTNTMDTIDNTTINIPQAGVSNIPVLARLSAATGSLFHSAQVAGTGMMGVINPHPSAGNNSGYVPLHQGAEMTTYHSDTNTAFTRMNPNTTNTAPSAPMNPHMTSQMAPMNPHVYTGIPVSHPPGNYRQV